MWLLLCCTMHLCLCASVPLLSLAALAKYSSCDVKHDNASGVCCDYCCPQNYVEQAYHDNPALYAKHPPTFLAQIKTKDNNADLCAARNYYETLKEHNVMTSLFLPDAAVEHEACYCIGTPGDPAAAGSPYAHLCNTSWQLGTTGCYTHALGFAGMIQPMLKFFAQAL
eukprot:m.92392 g.92392  ORF g.92392 m.92392 type:complete len:168 (+) comp26542_c0_seq2:145-648(+)